VPSPGPSKSRYDIVVVGAGAGGLTAAAFLAKAGASVCVLDRHYVAGGNATVFHRAKKYEFDVGVHYLGDCGPDGGAIPRILDGLGLGETVAFNEMDPDGFDILVFPGLTFRTPKGLDRYRDRLAELFPAERAGSDAYCKIAGSLWDEMSRAAAASKSLDELLFPVDLPTMSRWSRATITDVFDDCRFSRELRGVLYGFSGVHAVPASRCSAMLHLFVLMHYLNGAYYPIGGGQALSDALADVVRRHDGEIVLQRRVERILIEDGRATGVTTDKGETVRAPVVLSNADLKRTLLEMVGPEHLPLRYAQRTKSFRMALPLFVVYGATTLDLRRFGFGANNFHLLEDFDMDDCYASADGGSLPAENWVYITSASLKDPTNPRLAPPGEQNFQIMTAAPRQYASWAVRDAHDHKNPAYKALKDACLERILEATERRLIPGLRASLTWREAATPISHERFTLSTGGTSYGIRDRIGASGMRRPCRPPRRSSCASR